MATQPNATRADIIAMLKDGHSNSRIVRELRVDKHRVRRIREELGLPAFVPAAQTRTIEEKWALYARPLEDGHIEWTGERSTATRTPLLSYKDKHHSAAAIAFRIRTGRDPQGQAIADCGMKQCVAPDHVEDEPGRVAKRQELRRASGVGDRPGTCAYGHDQSVHGRFETDGTSYCAACKREWKRAPKGMQAARRSRREAIRRDIEALLRKGVPQMHIARQLRVAQATVQRTREELGLPSPRSGPRERYASIEETFRANTEPLDGGHLRWTGYTDASRGLPYVCFRQQRVTAGRVGFELHHGRKPVGPVASGCEVDGCLAGAHLEDRLIREANKRADRAFDAIFGGAA